MGYWRWTEANGYNLRLGLVVGYKWEGGKTTGLMKVMDANACVLGGSGAEGETDPCDDATLHGGQWWLKAASNPPLPVEPAVQYDWTGGQPLPVCVAQSGLSVRHKKTTEHYCDT